MNPQEEDMLIQERNNADLMRSRLEQENIGLMQRDIAEGQQNIGMIKEQLDLDKEMQRIENLLRGKYLSVDEYGAEAWLEPETNENKMLTNAGIQFILNSISWYLNKNTLLSNYSEEMIMQKMEDYSESLNDILFMRSEIYFLKPTLAECKSILEQRIAERVEKVMINMELRGMEGDENKIRISVVNEMDIERELNKIKENSVKDKLKGFEHLIRVIQDTIHSCYNRAWKGGERSSIRKSMHVSESIAPQMKQQRNQSNPMSWFRK